MSEEKKKRSIWQTVKDDGGFFFGFVGFLWWLGITPDKVGDFLYSISYYITPPIMLASGVWIGWSLKKRQAAQHIETNEKELAEAQGEIDKLNKCIAEAQSKSKALSDELAALKNETANAKTTKEYAFRKMLKSFSQEGISIVGKLLPGGTLTISANSGTYAELNEIGAIIVVEKYLNPYDPYIIDEVEVALAPATRRDIVDMPKIFKEEYKRITGKEFK